MHSIECGNITYSGSKAKVKKKVVICEANIEMQMLVILYSSASDVIKR